eukprot:364505-Chlamydomonas_euryale.AAC.17
MAAQHLRLTLNIHHLAKHFVSSSRLHHRNILQFKPREELVPATPFRNVARPALNCWLHSGLCFCVADTEAYLGLVS